ncbi:hypothetical protein FRACYDRAFT_244154 [Fragilariopsis cylindrus CCMP1102]|uniref:Uncharacterized protein n=1 Tax=Fragilariopsis cylindrus CCMP1102 TaxID=635003 RepID=A0A1E7F3X2_9STRA|nr:hypothetical protein FRACYDRAFT_244154 [Fragilariopsis cylindrus CCMP1102]|eukprot:OEU12881.1 hypothetical protein FRACYDRAFT_244154 [Fragilariopsis cylindrus CCMP1102]
MPSNSSKVLLDQVIRLLEIATKLEKSGGGRHRIEAATKYYESCYLMRQILAAGDASGEGSSSDSSTISTTCRRLLEDKIKHYTKVAQRLYFDDSASIAAGGGPAPTSVIISLLDDVVSVLTSTNHPLEQQHPSSSDPFTATLPQQQQYFHPRNVPTTTTTTTSTAVATTRSNPSTLLQLPVVTTTIVRRGGGRETVGTVNNRNNPESLSKQQQQQQQQQQQLRRHSHNNDNNNNVRTTGAKPRARLSKFAKVEAERKIHIKMNLANSKLGQSIDLDEYYYQNQHQNNNTDTPNATNIIIIDSYVDASEFYLDAIKLAEDHQKKYDSNNKSHLKLSLSSKVDPWRGPGASPSPSPIGSVIPKLKHLLISALDR